MQKPTIFLYFSIELFHFYLAALRQNKPEFMSPMDIAFFTTSRSKKKKIEKVQAALYYQINL